ncbi:carbohydrate binding domain-containing protein [Bacillus cereus group sp. N21]|uniref:carbohydrate binding domain-containing protein n=1 Tax=Bacillus cereus group sp. N21 TaxID=2794591 RepID=UPI0018F64F55|nr:carbohydrate binding domain-containing protein [Bacillus cereus group sp. N21]MBJ8030940.1 carbohydrate binding domain-containing protein [Bacillus cereus group sp. N21]
MRKLACIILALFLIFSTLTPSLILASEISDKTGWVQEGDKWYYFDKSRVKHTGWLQLNDKWYYLDSSGTMQTSWQSINGKWYYLDSSGAMQTGWQSINGKWYYLDSSGAMQTGWQSINGKWYYLDSSGAMQTGWQSINGKWYYLDSSGAMQTIAIQKKNFELQFYKDGYLENLKIITDSNFYDKPSLNSKNTGMIKAGIYPIKDLIIDNWIKIQVNQTDRWVSLKEESTQNNNLIGNGDFESDLEKQIWEKNLNAGAQLFKDTKEKPPEGSGASSIRVDVSKGEWSLASSTLVEYKQKVKVSPNQTYSMSIWSKTTGENISGDIDLTFYKDESNVINDEQSQKTYPIKSKEKWNKSENVFTTSPTTKFIEVKIQIGRNLGTSKGSIWFDSANLRAIQPKIVGKETKFNNWKVDTSIPGTVGKTSIDMKTVSSGDKQSYKIEVPKGSLSYDKFLPKLVQKIPVEPNQSYSLDTLIKGLGSNLNSTIEVSLKDEKNHSISDDNPRYEKQVQNISDWRKYGLFFKTSPTTKYVEIVLRPSWTLLGETGGDIWVGSVLLSKIDYNNINSNNVLNDGDFEEENAVSNWKFLKSDEKGSISQSKNEKSPKSKGGNSLSLKLSQGKWLGNDINAYQEVSVEPLKTYKFSAWAKTTNSKEIDPQVDLQFKDSEGNVVVDALETKTIHFTPQDKWEKKEFTFKTSLSTKKILVKLSASRHLATKDSYGTILFDSINLTPINGSQIKYSDIKLTGTNLISNNSFESNITDNWKREPYNDLSTLSQDKTIHAPQGTGNSSLKVDVKPKNNDYGNVILKQSVKVKPNQSYVFDSWIKSKNLSNAVVKMNVVLHGNNAPISESYIYKVTHIPEKSNTDWFNKRLIFKTSEQTTEAEIIIQVSYPNNKASGTVWIDNLSLVENNQVGVCDYSPYGGMAPFVPDHSWNQTFAELERLPKELEKVNADLKAALDRANEGVNQANAGINQMNQALNQMNQTMNDINGTMDQINRTLVQMNQSIKQIDEAVNGANGIINQMLLGFNQMNEGVNQANQAMSEMNDTLDQMIIDLSKLNFSFIFDFSDINIPEIHFPDMSIPEIHINLGKLDEAREAIRKLNLNFNFNAHNFSGLKINNIDFNFPSGYHDPELDERMVSFFEWFPILGQGFALGELANNQGSIYERLVIALSVAGGGSGKIAGKTSVKLTGKSVKEAEELVTATKRQNKQRSIFEKYTGYAAKGDVHHGLPEQFSPWFKEHGIDVNDPKYYYDLPRGLHKLKVDNGIHTNKSPLGKHWNRIWEDWIEEHPKATAQQIEDKLKSMVEGAGMKPYQAKPKK